MASGDAEQPPKPADTPFACVTAGITVSVSPVYGGRSNGGHQFQLRVSIRNDGEHGVMLMERHLWICSDGKMTAEVIGPGVVGLQPIIGPAVTFEYEGQALVYGTTGTAAGYYTFRCANGEQLVAHHPVVDLLPDGWLQ